MEALILYTHPSGDNNQVIGALLRERGTVSMFSRSSRGSSRQNHSSRTSKHKHQPEPFDYGRIYFKERPNGMPTITDFIPDTSFPALRLTIERLSCASLFCEALSRLVPEDCNEAPRLFDLAILSLKAISESPTAPSKPTTIAATLKALHLSLYGLALETGIIQTHSVEENQPRYLSEPSSPQKHHHNHSQGLEIPSSNNLITLVQIIEGYTNYSLKAKASVVDCIAQLRKSVG